MNFTRPAFLGGVTERSTDIQDKNNTVNRTSVKLLQQQGAQKAEQFLAYLSDDTSPASYANRPPMASGLEDSNGDGKVNEWNKQQQGMPLASELIARELVEQALYQQAQFVMLGENHNTEPGKLYRELVLQFKAAGKEVVLLYEQKPDSIQAVKSAVRKGSLTPEAVNQRPLSSFDASNSLEKKVVQQREVSLVENIQILQEQEIPVYGFNFSSHDKNIINRDEKMFEHVQYLVSQHPQAVFVIASGSFHSHEYDDDHRGISSLKTDLENPLSERLSGYYGKEKILSVLLQPIISSRTKFNTLWNFFPVSAGSGHDYHDFDTVVAVPMSETSARVLLSSDQEKPLPRLSTLTGKARLLADLLFQQYIRGHHSDIFAEKWVMSAYHADGLNKLLDNLDMPVPDHIHKDSFSDLGFDDVSAEQAIQQYHRLRDAGFNITEAWDNIMMNYAKGVVNDGREGALIALINIP